MFDDERSSAAQWPSGGQPDGKPADFEAFWAMSLNESREQTRPTVVRRVDSGLRTVDTYDVALSGFAGQPIRGWLHTPKDEKPAPLIVRFAGYGAGRGLPHQAGFWSAAGFACLSLDTRGQGAGGGMAGATDDPEGTGPSFPGFMTRGIQDRSSYYYRRVFVDAALAIEAAGRLPGVDAQQLIASGTSQGGGIALAATALSSIPIALMADVPFLSNYERAVREASEGPYLELAGFLGTNRSEATTVFSTLSYFDGVHFAGLAEAPALFSVALKDTVCPPATVFAAYDAYSGPKDIRVYPYNGHEGGQFHHEAEQLKWITAVTDHITHEVST